MTAEESLQIDVNFLGVLIEPNLVNYIAMSVDGKSVILCTNSESDARFIGEALLKVREGRKKLEEYEAAKELAKPEHLTLVK